MEGLSWSLPSRRVPLEPNPEPHPSSPIWEVCATTVEARKGEMGQVFSSCLSDPKTQYAATGQQPQQQQPQQQQQQQQGQQQQGQQQGKVFDVIFFPEPSGKMPCHNDSRPGGCKRGASCTFAHGPTSLGKFLSYLNSATQSCDICVFTITCDEIANAVMGLHSRGVRVRVISDDDQEGTLGSDVGKFRQAGIPVKVDHLKTHMHHKFCVIDNKLLLNGSFNWTRQAVLGNQENVVVLDNQFLIRQFSQQFEKLWAAFRA